MGSLGPTTLTAQFLCVVGSPGSRQDSEPSASPAPNADCRCLISNRRQLLVFVGAAGLAAATPSSSRADSAPRFVTGETRTAGFTCVEQERTYLKLGLLIEAPTHKLTCKAHMRPGSAIRDVFCKLIADAPVCVPQTTFPSAASVRARASRRATCAAAPASGGP